MDQSMEDVAQVVLNITTIEEGQLGQLSPVVDVRETSWVFDPDTLDVTKVPPPSDSVLDIVHQQQGGIELDELEIGYTEEQPLAQSSPQFLQNDVFPKGFRPLAASSPRSPVPHHNVTFNVAPERRETGHNSTFVLSDTLEVAPELNKTFHVGSFEGRRYSSELTPEFNKTFQAGTVREREYCGEVQGIRDDTSELNRAILLSDSLEGAPGPNRTFQMGGPDGMMETAFEPNRTFVLSDTLEVAPGLNRTFEVNPAQATNWLGELDEVMEAVSELNRTAVVSESRNVAPGMNETFPVTTGQTEAAADITFEVPRNTGFTLIPPGWQTPMMPINLNLPPRPIIVDIEAQEMDRRQDEMFLRSMGRDSAGRRLARPQPVTVGISQTSILSAVIRSSKNEKRGGGGGRMRM